ncbi:MAG: hypothetical protein FWD82_08200 [Defluviitaleaceae bacterium]|nr:hypothetical protein [Defluviitaleaceae bacterium]
MEIFDFGDFCWNLAKVNIGVFDAISMAFSAHNRFLEQNLEPQLYEELKKFINEIETHK